MAAQDSRKADLKVIILGPASVGKTCFMQRYMTGEFNDKYVPTMGAALAIRKWGHMKVALWDTAGEEKFAPISALYCRQASAAILAYDITDADSFKSLKTVFIPLLENVDGACLTVVIGCKSDLSDESKKAVSVEDGKALAITQHEFQLERARRHSAASVLDKVDAGNSFFETSALTGKNVEEVFTYIQEILVPHGKGPAPRSVVSSGAVNLEQPQEPVKKKCC